MKTLSQNQALLFLQRELSDDEARAVLEIGKFQDARLAAERLQNISHAPTTQLALAACLPQLLAALSHAASPDAALVAFERFAQAADDPQTLFSDLGENPRLLEMLVLLFSGSQFLTEILLKHPDYFQLFAERRELSSQKTVQQLYAEAQMALALSTEFDHHLDALRRFQRWELLRVGASDFFGLLDLPNVTLQLSRLAEALVRQCLTLASWRAGQPSEGFVVVALGKLGGEELNYSSDIDLLFLSANDPTEHQTLSQWLIDALVRMTPEGFLYRVDMRLRPWGGVGPLVSSLDGYLSYVKEHARLWEKQALLKARVIAGDEAVGNAFMRAIPDLIYNITPEEVRASVAGMKRQTESHLRQRGRGWGEVKLGEGSIRDAEFVAQYLQLANGGQHANLRTGKTLEALAALQSAGFLPADDYRVLTEGYIFMRAIEHYLQLTHYRQTSTLPSATDELTILARRLGFGGSAPAEQFLARYEQQRSAIRAVYNKHLHAKIAAASHVDNDNSAELFVKQHLAQLDPAYTATFDEAEIEQHARLAEQLSADNLVEVEALPLENGRWRLTIVAYDFLGALSLICGLLAVHGFDIVDGDVFTYEPASNATPTVARTRGYYRDSLRRSFLQQQQTPEPITRRKIVDVFTVRAALHDVAPNVWTQYAQDLAHLFGLLQTHQASEAQGELVKRFAMNLNQAAETPATLYPIEIDLDNLQSTRYTVLHIEGQDTNSFLYELTNALAMNDVHIARVTVDTVSDRVQDILHVTDARGEKIISPAKQRELRAAIVLVKHFTHLLPRSPDPESALTHFRAFLGQLFSQPNWPDDLVSLEKPEVLQALAQLLGVSEFLWNDFLRMQYANLFPIVQDVSGLAAARTPAQWESELRAAISTAADENAKRNAINAYKDRELFRIDMRYILGHITQFGQFSTELSGLAEVILRAALDLVLAELTAQHGTPLLDAAGGVVASHTVSRLAVCALGKMGGRELGFASDIELMFVYEGNGLTSGPEVISTAEFYERVVQNFMGVIHTKREGIFEIDLRLRPYGNAGSLAVSMASFARYFAPGGPAWAYERQALIRLRPIAGDTSLGQQLVEQRDAFIYTGEPFDAGAMRAMRERQLRHLVTAGTFNAKFSLGGAVDIEYLVQGLQITHGHEHPNLRLANTRAAIEALRDAKILTEEDFSQLTEAHNFIRRLVNALRMVRGNTRDLTVPPNDSEEFRFLAARLGYGYDTKRLEENLARYPKFVQELSARLLNG